MDVKIEDNTKEVWKDIPNYEGYYQVSNKGNIRSVDRMDCQNRFRKGKMCKKLENEDGYYKVSLSKNGIEKRFFIHRLVAMAFIENPNDFDCINHKDENKKNNCIENLEWCTRKYNNNYGKRNQKIVEKQSIKTAMVDIKTGKILKVFKSAKEASIYVNGDQSVICKARNGKRKTAYGFGWEVV